MQIVQKTFSAHHILEPTIFFFDFLPSSTPKERKHTTAADCSASRLLRSLKQNTHLASN